MNNEQRTFEDFLDEVCNNHYYTSFNRFLWDERQVNKIAFYQKLNKYVAEAAQRFAAWKARTTAIAFAELIRQNGFSSMGLGFDTWRKGPEGAARQYEFKTTEQLYDTFSGLPVEQGQKADGWISVRDRLPTESDADENGKVLIYRTLNDHQKPLSKSIHDWNMVKHCEDDTLWQSLPALPLQVNKDNNENT